MSQTSEGSSITGWILELGGGKDPSWAASIIRTVAAWVGWWTLYHNNVDYGDYTYLARFLASSAIALFSASLVIKIVKSLVFFAAREFRIGQGMRFASLLPGPTWRLLREQVIKGNDHITLDWHQTGTDIAVKIGAVSVLSTSSSKSGATCHCQISESMITFFQHHAASGVPDLIRKYGFKSEDTSKGD